MDLLEELQREAEQAKTDPAVAIDLEAIYEEQLRPVMLRALQYLRKLVTQLEIAKPQVTTDFEVTDCGALIQLRQSDYHVGTDDQERPTRVRLGFDWLGTTPLRCDVEEAVTIRRLNENLRHWHLPFRTRDLPPKRPKVPHVRFEIDPEIRAAIQFSAPTERGQIGLTMQHVERLGTIRHDLDAEGCNDAFFDQLGRFILHRENQFLKLEVPEEYRRRLQRQLHREQADASSDTPSLTDASAHPEQPLLRMRLFGGKKAK